MRWMHWVHCIGTFIRFFSRNQFLGTVFRFRNHVEKVKYRTRFRESDWNIQSLTTNNFKMKGLDLKDKSYEYLNYKTQRIKKIKTDLHDIRQMIVMMDFLIEKKRSDRLTSYMPELKTFVKSLKKNTKRYLS